MAAGNGVMDRRGFLFKSAILFSGAFFGLCKISKAVASDALINRPKVSLIIDDIGFSQSRARRFLDLGIPLTFSILPRLPQSQDLAKEIHACGHKIMLHQPMEPYDPWIDPGPGALYVGYEEEMIYDTLDKNIMDTPHIIGVNNHMGSRFTSRPKEMHETLGIIKEKNLFFIDSLTTSHSMGYRTAKILGMSTAYRNIFIDLQRSEMDIVMQLYNLKDYALRNGHAIGIGHPFPETAKAIRHVLDDFKASRVSLVYVSDLLPFK